MQTITAQNFKEKPNNFCVTVLGNFDGVHLAHTKLILSAKKMAEEKGYKLCVYTFSRHPLNYREGFPGLITSPCEKEELIRSLGADILFLESFEDVKDLSCEEFCGKVLIDKLNTKIAFCGKNFRFGKNRSGDAETLKKEMSVLGGNAFAIDDVKSEDGNVISSTIVRKHILDGDTEKAKNLLGRPYSLTAEVVHGRHLATHLGAPTINQTFPQGKIVPKNGVYAVCLIFDGKKHFGVANVGVKPTVTSNEACCPILCETHILDYKGDLYGKTIKTEFYRKLRDEKKFASIKELSDAIKNDVLNAVSYFKEREEKNFENR
ncbi:MAG: riboflavin biosynthesis protein RibF [Ruminococcaceae bacterium]|nr:riboflavin biosynthesis protein RibF [Oscillospiraceae bacterium]